MVEEGNKGAIHGQTSWISCGVKIQEMQWAEIIHYMSNAKYIVRLAVTYELWASDSHTINKAQVIEN